MSQPQSPEQGTPPALSERQAAVLRAMVMAYLGEGAPIGSATLSHLMPMSLSSASIRYTMGELAELGLVEKPHASSGRLPTELGLRRFIDELLDPGDLASYEKRVIASSVDEADVGELATVASQLLSERTRLVGFAVSPRLDLTPLLRVGLVRLTRERLLVVLVSKTGAPQHRVIADDGALGQPELDRIATLLSERVAGRTLRDVREALAREARELRHAADRVLRRALEIGAQLLEEPSPDPEDLVIATRLALLDQPEFRDPRRLREVFSALEERDRLLRILDRLLDREGVRVVLGDELEAPGLRSCALVATAYGGQAPLGAVGVIGPSRMDFGRAIAVVGYLSAVLTEKLHA